MAAAAKARTRTAKARKRTAPNPKAALYAAGHVFKLSDYSVWREYLADRREARHAR